MNTQISMFADSDYDPIVLYVREGVLYIRIDKTFEVGRAQDLSKQFRNLPHVKSCVSRPQTWAITLRNVTDLSGDMRSIRGIAERFITFETTRPLQVSLF